MDARFANLEGETLFNELLKAKVIFGLGEDGVPAASLPLMKEYGIGNADITRVFDTPLWIPVKWIPEHAATVE
jgi:nucleotidyltransferase/DNA polymerase involved in DNA repair